jgi:hypothetical protein
VGKGAPAMWELNHRFMVRASRKVNLTLNFRALWKNDYCGGRRLISLTVPISHSDMAARVVSVGQSLLLGASST